MRQPIPHYAKGDLTAANLRLAGLDKARDRLGRPCRKMRKWVPDPVVHGFYGARAIAKLRGCRYPVGDTHATDFYFCNKARKWPGQYCKEHVALCYRPFSGWGF